VARKTKNQTAENASGARLGFEEKLWAAADKMRSYMDPAEYKHVVLGLIFLKYISDAFEEKHEQLKLWSEDPSSDWYVKDPEARYVVTEDRDEYLAENIFWVPPEARWNRLQASAKQPEIGRMIDDLRLSLPVATFRRQTASLRASTECRTPASHASTVPASASTSSSAAENLIRPSCTLRVIGPGAECSSSRSPSFMTSSTTFKPSPLRSVIAFRLPSCHAFSSRKRVTSAAKLKLCSGPCKGLSDSGCGLVPILYLPQLGASGFDYTNTITEPVIE
jgi:hypothetical protein